MFDRELALIDRLEELEKAEESAAAVEVLLSHTEGVSTAVVSSGEDVVGVVNQRSEVVDETVSFFPLSEPVPRGRLASEEIAAFNAFAAKMFPLPGLLDPDVMS